jgi:hypothetical protein
VTIPVEAVVPFRGGREPGIIAEPMAVPSFSGPHVLLADLSEFEPGVADAMYLAWSKAIIIRAAYGDAHDDHAWYGGQRRALLHAGGVRFCGIYQYIVAAQDPVAQAEALVRLLGKLQPGEKVIADIEEGQGSQGARWRAWAGVIRTALGDTPWNYSGRYFALDHGLQPVSWIADYSATEPGVPHQLWQFTDSFQVPGVGVADCSVFHGDIDQLAALAFQASKPKPPPPPHPGPAWPAGTVLREGDSGAAVRALQTALCDSGIRGVRGITVDSVFGAQTLTSLRNFQAAKGLTVDGIAGPATRAALLGAGQ